MPIAFPPVPIDNFLVRQRWLRLGSKSFNVVPAPNFCNNSLPKSANTIGGSYGWALNPCKSVQQWPNLRELGRGYRDPGQTSLVNPANMIDECYDETTGFDRDLGQQNIRIVGASRDATGAGLANCQVKVFRTADDILVASTVSDGSGNWTAYPNQTGPYYYVEYKAGSPDVFGTSPNTNIASTFTPGG